MQADDLQEMERLLCASADPNAVDLLGETPLFEACAKESSVAVALPMIGVRVISCT